MDGLHTQTYDSSATVDFPQSQELFSDQEHDSGESIIVPQESVISRQNDNSVLFRDQNVCPPRRTYRARGCKKLISYSGQDTATDESSDYEPPKKPTLKEIFMKHFRRKRKKKAVEKKKDSFTQRKSPSPSSKKRKPYYTLPLQHTNRRLLHHGTRFPFASKKYLSLKQCFAYEQYVLGGFLNYMKNMKYENHLKKSLMDLKAGEELEKEGLETRKLKYMDDEEPLSPISDAGEIDDEHEAECCDAEIVENSSFILGSRIPKKEEWQRKRK